MLGSSVPVGEILETYKLALQGELHDGDKACGRSNEREREWDL